MSDAGRLYLRAGLADQLIGPSLKAVDRGGDPAAQRGLADQLIGPSLKGHVRRRALVPAGGFGRSIDRPFIEGAGPRPVAVAASSLADQLIGPSLKD